MEPRRIWDLEPKVKLVLGLLMAFSLAMFIAGAIMLAIGIIKANSCGKCKEPGPIVAGSLPTAIFSSSYTKEFQWNNDLLNPNSQLFLNTTQKIIKNIKDALHPKRRKRSTTEQGKEPLSIVVTKFMQASDGIDFYTTMIFPDNKTTSQDVEKNLDSIGFSTDAFVDPTSNCLIVKPPHGAPTTTTSTVAPTPTTRPLPDGVFCDVSDNNLLNVYLIDVAVPAVGTLEDKLSKIRSYLSTADFTVNLNKTGTWNNVKFLIVTYLGEIAQPLTNFCHSDADWQNAVKLLNSSVNPTSNNFHRLNTGLQYVENNLGNRPVGEGRNLIIITDGIDITDEESYSTALRLRNKFKYTISAIVASTSQTVRDYVKESVSDSSHFLPIQSFNWLSNKGVVENAANWACNAFYPTSPSPTLSPAPITLEYTTTTNLPTSTITHTTKPITPSPVPKCIVDILFLIDESQTMLLQGYSQSLSLVYAISEELSKQNNQSHFAIITYNSAIVFNSTKYKPYNDFITDVKNMPIKEGTADMLLGFTTAQSLLAQGRYSQKGVRSVLYFLSDGLTNKKTDINSVSSITNDIRGTYETEIIAIGLNETAGDEKATKQAIGWDLMNGYVPSKYICVSNLNKINSTEVLNTVTSAITCKSDNQFCEVDLTFVIEVSLAEQLENIEVEKRVVNGLISHYSGQISAIKGKVSLVYFSAPNGLQSAEYGKTGILYSQVASAETAINYLRNTDFTPLGGASDIKLAMNLTLQVLSSDVTGNSKYVLFFARGSYYEAPNCCDDPSAVAKMVREYPNTKVQGVLLGQFPNKKNLDLFTGSNSVDANALLVKNHLGQTNITASSLAIQRTLIPLIDYHYLNSKCSPIEPMVAPCVEFVDINIILHGSSGENWDIITKFVSKEIIPNLLGTSRMTSPLPLTQGDAVNLAIITYSGTTVKNLANFTHMLSPLDYANLVTKAQWDNTTNSPQLHLAYQMATENMKVGREFASKTLLVITDTLSRSDLKAAQVIRQAMPLSYLYGITVKDTTVPDTVPGENDGLLLNYIELLSEKSPRSARSYANKATAGICRFIPPPTTTVTITTPTSAPCIIPSVGDRELWPDITILIDTSTGTDGMDPHKFEYMRVFLRTTFLEKYAIGTQKSRFSIGTFNNDVHFSCLFSDITNYCDLKDCLNEKLSYNPISNQLNRDINSALQSTMLQVYDPSARVKSDYRPLKENFLYLFTLGKSTTEFSASLSSLKQLGVRTIGIGLDSDMSINDLSQFGPNSYNVIKWTDDKSGIISNPKLTNIIFESTTKRQLPSLTNFFADFYFVIDQSVSIQQDNADVVQFLHDFTKQLTLDVHKSRISVIPYSSTIGNVCSLTDNDKDFDSWFKQWAEQTPSTEKSSNIGEAIDNVASQLPKAANKATYVIYIVRAAQSDGAEKSAQLASKKWVVPIVLQLSSEVKYSNKLATPNNIYKLANGAGLRNWVSTIPEESPNQMNTFFNDLFSDQEKYDSKNFPLDDVVADILILFDETGLTPDQFVNVKQFILDLTDRFSIGNRYTQFALQAYNGEVIPEDGFHFYQSFNSTTVKKLVDDLSIKQMPNTTTAALPGALEQCLLFILQSKNGWREGTTYTIILSNANEFDNNLDKVNSARKIMSVSKVFAIGMNNHHEPLVKSLVNSGFYGTVKSPSELKISAKTSLALLKAIDTDYKKQVYPDKTSLDTIEADHIILIDNNERAFTLNAVKIFLRYVKSIINEKGHGQSRLAVINFDSTGVRKESSWDLNTHQDTLDTAIDYIRLSGDNKTSNLNKAITYFLENPIQFGFRSNQQVFVTLIASASDISPRIPDSVAIDLNNRCQTFVIQVDGHIRHKYLQQFLGKSGYDQYLYDDIYGFTPSLFDSYRKFIRQKYIAWPHKN